jgi:hypothetical protein
LAIPDDPLVLCRIWSIMQWRCIHNFPLFPRHLGQAQAVKFPCSSSKLSFSATSTTSGRARGLHNFSGLVAFRSKRRAATTDSVFKHLLRNSPSYNRISKTFLQLVASLTTFQVQSLPPWCSESKKERRRRSILQIIEQEEDTRLKTINSDNIIFTNYRRRKLRQHFYK